MRGKQLEVDYLLEGSVLREGRQLRINVQFVRVSDDFPLWSGRFDRELTNVFVIQDEISRGIANSLRLHLGGGRRRYETSVEAFDLYLRARAVSRSSVVVSRRDGQPALSPEQRFTQSIELFEQAIGKDPTFAPAYAALAATYATRSIQFPLDRPADELSKMRGSAEQAIQLDPLLPEAHAAFGMYYAREGRWDQAEKSFRRAIEIDPGRSTTYTDYAYWLLAVLGRHADALRQLQVAKKVDPQSTDVRLTMAFVLVAAGRSDEAVDHCQNCAPGFSVSLVSDRPRGGSARQSSCLLIIQPGLETRKPGAFSVTRTRARASAQRPRAWRGLRTTPTSRR
jgi:tetratricopeptide (TPR) repeat protein